LKRIKKESAIEFEGINLSGLPAQKSDLVTLVLSMGEEIFHMENAKVESNQRAKLLEKNLLIHESTIKGMRTAPSSSEKDTSPLTSSSTKLFQSKYPKLAMHLSFILTEGWGGGRGVSPPQRLVIYIKN